MSIRDFIRRLNGNPDLMQRMFVRLGVRDWFAQEPQRAEAYRRAAIRCGTCSHGDACQQWLDSSVEATHAPGFCRNAQMIERIRVQTSGTA